MGEILKDGGLNIWSSATNLEYWSESISGTSTVNRDGISQIEGDYCCRMAIDGSDSAAYIYQAIGLVPNRKYRITIWYATAAGKTGKFWLKDSATNVYLKSDGTWQGGATDITLPDSNAAWRKYQLYFTAYSLYQNYIFYLGRGTSVSNSLYYDRISILSAENRCGMLYENEWDIGTLTALTEATYFPASNTRHRWHKKTWRSTAIDVQQWLKVDRGHSTPGIKAFVNRNNNFTSAATIKLELNASDVWTSPTYNHILQYNAHTIAAILTTTQELQWLRHAITDTANPDGYLETGRLYFGSIFEPERNYILGGGERAKADQSVISSSEGGQVSSIELERFRMFEYTFERVELEDYLKFTALFEAMGQAKGWFFIQDLGDPMGSTAYVRFSDPLGVTPEYQNRFTIHMSLEELR
jgi:hypothetical protein